MRSKLFHLDPSGTSIHHTIWGKMLLTLVKKQFWITAGYSSRWSSQNNIIHGTMINNLEYILMLLEYNNHKCMDLRSITRRLIRLGTRIFTTFQFWLVLEVISAFVKVGHPLFYTALFIFSPFHFTFGIIIVVFIHAFPVYIFRIPALFPLFRFRKRHL